MTGDDVKVIAVVGGRTTGPEITAIFARFGFETRLTDPEPEVLTNTRAEVEEALNELIAGGFLSKIDAEAGRDRLTVSTDLDRALDGADFVLESVQEQLERKQDVLKEIERKVGPDVVIASNTAVIPISDLQDGMERPERVVGMHWSDPPHLIPVVEVVKGSATTDDAAAITYRVAERAGMIPALIKRDVAGFVESRILYAILREALDLLERGVADARDIDEVVKWGIGYRLAVIPPLQLLDAVGLDAYRAVAGTLNAELCDRSDVAPTVEEKVAKGEQGIKSGRGIYDYPADEIPDILRKRVRLLLAARQALNE